MTQEKNRRTFFEEARDWSETACLYTRPDPWGAYGWGYQLAAERLCDDVLNDGGILRDVLVLPMVALYRHSFELQLKDIIQVGSRLLDDPVNPPLHHRIDALWSDAKRIIRQSLPGDPLKRLNEVEAVLKELARVDPTGEGFRYPVDTQGNPTLAAIDRIDLGELRRQARVASDFLDGAFGAIRENLQLKYEH